LEIAQREQLENADLLHLAFAPVTVQDVSFLLGDGSGNFTTLQHAHASGFPPYSTLFNLSLNVAKSAQVAAALNGRDGFAKILYEASLQGFVVATATLTGDATKAIAPVPDDQRKLPDGIENVTRDISTTQISSFNLFYKESQTVEWNIVPQGQLQNITNLKDKDGNPLRWGNYARVIDLDDPFFRQLRVNTYVNADFDKLPIHSVEVKLLYGDRPMPNLAPDAPEREVVLRKPDEIGHFATYVENNNWKYKYSYQVNYKNESKIFQSEPIETGEGNLTIGVGDIGILTVNASAGNLN